jgi:hypothetical protein
VAVADPLPFLAIDGGTATTSVSLVARLGGRFRLLGSVSGPAALPLDSLVEALLERVASAEPGLLLAAGPPTGWPRLHAITAPTPSAVLAAPSRGALVPLEAAVAAAGWRIAARLSPETTDPIAATGACLDPDVHALFLAGDAAGTGSRGALPDLAALLAAAARRRSDLWCLLAGDAGEQAAAFPPDRVLSAPAPERVPGREPSALREAARNLRIRVARGARAGAVHAGPGSQTQETAALLDGRAALARAIASVGALLDLDLEVLDIGHSGAMRAIADRDGVRASLDSADAAFVPSDALVDEGAADAILAWVTVRADPSDLRDRLRMLQLAPWSGLDADGARLRLAAFVAALRRLDVAWRRDARLAPGRPVRRPDLVVLSGGAATVASPALTALALADGIGQPGPMSVAVDHARLLAPLGTLPAEADRQRLLADLLDDLLLPLGAVLVCPPPRPRLSGGTIRVATGDGILERPLVPGTVQMLPVRPGTVADVEVAGRDMAWRGAPARRAVSQVAGGICGLLVDARDRPLRLPERPEQRRELLESWQRAVTGPVLA